MALVVLVNGLRGPMLALRRFVVCPDPSTGDFTWTTDFGDATLWTSAAAKQWSIENGLWPNTVHNWTPGYGPPQPTEP